MKNIFHDTINLLFIPFPSRSAHINRATNDFHEWKKNKMNFRISIYYMSACCCLRFSCLSVRTTPSELFIANFLGLRSLSMENSHFHRIIPNQQQHHSNSRTNWENLREKSEKTDEIFKEPNQLHNFSIVVYIFPVTQRKTFPHSVNELEETREKNLITERKLWMSN